MKHRDNPNLFRNNVILLTSLVALIVLFPLFTMQESLILHLMLATVIYSGIYSLEFQEKRRNYLLFLGTLTIGTGACDYIWHNDFIKLLFHISFLLFNLTITLFIIGHIARKKKVTLHLVISTINGYLMLGLQSSFLLYITEIIHKIINTDGTYAIRFSGTESPVFHDFIYFGFVTLTTLGYGDVIPLTSLAKSAAILISTTGQIYMTILVAMIVGKYLNEQNH